MYDKFGHLSLDCGSFNIISLGEIQSIVTLPESSFKPKIKQGKKFKFVLQIKKLHTY